MKIYAIDINNIYFGRKKKAQKSKKNEYTQELPRKQKRKGNKAQQNQHMIDEYYKAILNTEAKNKREENPFFEKILREIKEEDPGFQPNVAIGAHLRKMQPEKLAVFGKDIIKSSLGVDKEKTERTIDDINIVRQFDVEELKLLMKNPLTREHIYSLMSGVVPSCAREATEARIKSTLSKLKEDI